MLWKVYNIQTGKILRAGFESEEEAKEWLELKSDDLSDDYEIEEMDSDEVEEWYESQELDAEEVKEEEEPEEDDDDRDVGFGEEYYDGQDLADDDDLPILDDEEL